MRRALCILVFACTLSACAMEGPNAKTYFQNGRFVRFDPDKDPYWENPPWTVDLLKAVQSSVQDPVDPADTTTHGPRGTIKFTYANGVIEYPDIVESTGNLEMDKLMLHQIASVKPPQAMGRHADEPHEFIMEIGMLTPYEAFQSGIYAAIDARKAYSKEAIIGGHQGITVVDFDYLDGKAYGILITLSSKEKEFDRTSMSAVTQAAMPPAPGAYAGKTLHMEAVFCYSMRESEDAKDPCPTGRNVIEVTGTRIRR